MDDALARRIQGALADPAAPFDAALVVVLETLGAQIATLHRLEADEHLHLIAATPGLPEPVLAASRRIPLGKGIAGEAAATRQPVSLCNLQTDTSGVARPGAKATGLGGSLCVPILAEDAVIGTLGVGWVAPRDVSASDTATLVAAGRLLGGALSR